MLKLLLSRSLLQFLAGFLVAASAVVYAKWNYVPRAELDEMKLELELKNAQILSAAETAAANQKLYESQLSKNNELHRHFDKLRTRIREIDDETSRAWRNTPVPGPVADRLRELPPPGQPTVRAHGS